MKTKILDYIDEKILDYIDKNICRSESVVASLSFFAFSLLIYGISLLF